MKRNMATAGFSDGDDGEEGKEGKRPEVVGVVSVNFESQAPSLTDIEQVFAGGLPADLAALNLSRNMLSNIGTRLYSLTSLTSLDLSRNRLTHLDDGISALTQLVELSLLSNKLKMSTLPLEELAAMPALQLVDLSYNEKLEKVEASARLRALFGARVRLCSLNLGAVTNNQDQAPKESACDRDSTLLSAQLAPWSTPHLRRRLAAEFGIQTDPDTVPREEMMAILLRQYDQAGLLHNRRLKTAQGVPLNAQLVRQIEQTLSTLAWPTSTRERPKVAADKYFTMNRPMTKFTSEMGAKNLKNEAKLQKYGVLWALINQAIQSVDPEFAQLYTGVAVTNGFTDSPHIDTGTG
ncbi:hypothetical protein B484DRAFT_393094 [Ochromonadaceae sp. CCMP2298]|nr:hypothetical protein B484DRAFT_393094 [Ochromonadaceae sp. CCMP2298]